MFVFFPKAFCPRCLTWSSFNFIDIKQVFIDLFKSCSGCWGGAHVAHIWCADCRTQGRKQRFYKQLLFYFLPLKLYLNNLSQVASRTSFTSSVVTFGAQLKGTVWSFMKGSSKSSTLISSSSVASAREHISCYTLVAWRRSWPSKSLISAVVAFLNTSVDFKNESILDSERKGPSSFS